MQALLNDIELDIQELKVLIEAVSRQSETTLKNVAKRNILQMRSRLDLLLQQLEVLQPPVLKPPTIVESVKEPVSHPVVEPMETHSVEEQEVETIEQESHATVATILADRIKSTGELHRSISLNDSFRFSRELFDNDAELMNRVLQQIGEMNSLDTALAFVSSKVKVDEENEAMADFVELLKKYFN